MCSTPSMSKVCVRRTGRGGRDARHRPDSRPDEIGDVLLWARRDLGCTVVGRPRSAAILDAMTSYGGAIGRQSPARWRDQRTERIVAAADSTSRVGGYHRPWCSTIWPAAAPPSHQRGPMMVIAGAGADPLLCSRLAWLVDQGEDPARVLAVTFTRQAAEELRGRAEDLLGRSHETLRVSTFHSWAQDVVRHHGLERGLVAPRRPADQEVRKMLLLDHLGDLDLRLHRIKGDLGFLVDDFVTHDRYEAFDELPLAGEATAEETTPRELFARGRHERYESTLETTRALELPVTTTERNAMRATWLLRTLARRPSC